MPGGATCDDESLRSTLEGCITQHPTQASVAPATLGIFGHAATRFGGVFGSASSLHGSTWQESWFNSVPDWTRQAWVEQVFLAIQ